MGVMEMFMSFIVVILWIYADVKAHKLTCTVITHQFIPLQSC